MQRFIVTGLVFALLGFTTPAGAAPEIGEVSKIELLRRSVAALPDNLDLRYYLGSALLEKGLVPEAIAELSRAYPAYVDSKEMNYTLAIAYYQLGDLDSSLLYLEEAEALGALLEPETYSIANVYYNLGLKYLERSSFPEAEQALRKVLQIDPGRLQIHRTLGELYNRMGDPDRSLVEFEAYYKAFPEDGEIQHYLYSTYLNRGLVLLNSGKTNEATALFDQAMSMTRENALAAYFKGYLAYKEGHYSLAAKTLLAALPDLPEEARNNSSPLLYNCALELSNNPETLPESREILRPLLERENPAEQDLFLGGTILMKLGEYEEALALFEKILAQNPAHQGALINLLATQGKAVEQLIARAQGLLAEEKIPAAQQAVEAALKIDPANKRAGALNVDLLQRRDQLANNLLADAEKSLEEGKFSTALQQVRSSLSVSPELEAGRVLQEKILTQLSQEIADRLEQGEAALTEQKVESAAEAFNAVLALDPGHPQALKGMQQLSAIVQKRAAEKVAEGEVALASEDPVSAQTAFTAALQMLPDLRTAQEGQAKAQALIAKLVKQKILTAKDALSKGNYTEALRQLQGARLLDDSPLVQQEIESTQSARSARVAELIASADQSLAQNELKRSANFYRKALEIDPDNSEIKTRVAGLNQATATALAATLRQAREALQGKMPSRALAAYKKALDLDPANAEAMQGLRDAEERDGKQLLSLESKAAAALAQGDYPRSEQLFKEVLTLSPGRAAALEGIRKLRQLRGEGVKAGDEERLYLEGIALYTEGHYGEAVATWKKVLLLDPKHVKAGMNIEKAQRKLQSIKERRDG